MTRFAQVTVNIEAPLEGVFHYHVPADLVGTVRPGHLVEVEFGRRIAQGIVVALDDRSPVPETKPVIALILPDPILSKVQLELGQWLSQTYLTPLMQCLRLMLPPGLSQRADVSLELVPEAVEGARLTQAQQQLVQLLEKRGDLRGRQISQLLPNVDWRPAAEQLVRRNILRRGSVLNPPRSRPKQIRTAQLVVGPDEVAAALPSLGRKSKAAEVLEWLAGNPDPLPTVEEARKATGCTLEHLQALSDAGHVSLTPGRTLVTLLETEPAGADSRVRALLRRAHSPVIRTENQLIDPVTNTSVACTPADLEAMEGQGLIRQMREPPTVSLAIDGEQVKGVAAELRRAGPYLRALEFLAQEPEPVDIGWVYAETGCQLRHLKRLADAGLVALGEKEVWRDPLADQDFVPDTAPVLTPHQARAWERIELGMRADRPDPPSTPSRYLLHGVTGSGKTEIYLRAIALALERGQGAIALVPEIALTPQTIRRFSARFPGRVAVLHSRLTEGERYDTWRRVRQGLVDIVIGPRSALFAPFSRLGVIVLDEEHDEAYKQDPPVRPPYYHARETAIHLAHLTGATLIMGSATPDLVTYHRAQGGEFQLLELPQRIMGHRDRVSAQVERYQVAQSQYQPISDGPQEALMTDLPPVQLVDMRQELRAGNRSIFSRALSEALAETLRQEQQAILFLNRRGTSTFVFCRDCGLVLKCPRCDAPLTYHRPGMQLACHHCGRTEPQPERCPRCGSYRVKYFGLGTEGVEAEVLKQFPSARVLRWDRDTTGARGAHDLFLREFTEGNADVLVGTQMIAKGLDLPLVTLVGVISADVSLGLPDYRTGERTFQLLTQVAGRAGRGLLGGRALVQTFNPEHYAIRAAAEHDYAGFYVAEVEFRARVGYPPFKRLARLEHRDPVLERGRREAERVAGGLHQLAAEKQLSATEILGPTQPFFGRLAGRYRWQIVIRAPDPAQLLRDFPRPDRWMTDIDPMSLL